MHAKETRNVLEKLFETRSRQVPSDETIYSVGTANDKLRIVAKRPQEAAKMFAMYLLHAGVLCEYSKGNKPNIITVSTASLLVDFKAWFSNRPKGTVIILESCFVKKVMDNFVTPLEEPTVVNESPMSISQTGDVALDTLKNVFGHNSFRGKQLDVVNTILQGHDCIALLPTGAGKTICYAVPGIILHGISIVITPLIALILDQVQRLRGAGVNVSYLISSMKDEEKEVVRHNLSMPNPSYKFLFTTPETITTPSVKSLIQLMSTNKTLAQFVIDEAHCIDYWGFNFRPSYSSLGILKDYDVPIVALTATATDRTVSVISLQLRLQNPIIIAQSFLRSNLNFSVVSKKSTVKDDIANLINENFSNCCGIIYCSERKDTIEMAYTLNSKGVNATYFHAHESLNAMSMYCISNNCRTKQLLQYFGEAVLDCNNCDVCQRADHQASRDASEDGKNVIQCVQGMLHLVPKVTFKAIALTFVGSRRKEVTAKKFNQVDKFGSGKGRFSFQSASKFIQLLVVRNILKEELPSSTESTSTATIAVGPEARALLEDEISVNRLE
ncbi:hypothetical protein ACROYT_G009251 [Oculina patagonica]